MELLIVIPTQHCYVIFYSLTKHYLIYRRLSTKKYNVKSSIHFRCYLPYKLCAHRKMNLNALEYISWRITTKKGTQEISVYPASVDLSETARYDQKSTPAPLSTQRRQRSAQSQAPDNLSWNCLCPQHAMPPLGTSALTRTTWTSQTGQGRDETNRAVKRDERRETTDETRRETRHARR